MKAKSNTVPFFAVRPACLSLAVFAFAGAANAQFYAVTGLGTLGGTNALAYGMNNHEQIVGAAQTAMGDYRAFMFDDGRLAELGTLGGSNSWCYGINDAGWMVGAAELPATNMHAFLCTNAFTNGLMMDLGSLGGSNSVARMIDLHGEMVGWSQLADGSHHAFFMTNYTFGDMMDLGSPGGTNSEAYCINSNRVVVGYEMMSDGSTQPIMYTNAMFGSSSMMGMGMGGMGASGGQSWFVNDLGQTAGQARMSGGSQHAFVSGSGGMMGRMNVDLGTLGGSNSVAYCLNTAGAVVGMADLSNGVHHAFIVTNAFGGTIRMMDLNGMIPTNSGWELMEARSINSSGQIVGWGMYGGHTNAFLLTPVSAPVMMVSAPSPQIVGSGAQLSLHLAMSAAEPLTYQWRRNGMVIPGATDAVLNLPPMTMGDAGQYTVTARNAVGTVASSSVAISMFDMVFADASPRLRLAAPAGTRFRVDHTDTLGSPATWQTMTNLTMTSSMSQMNIVPAMGSPGGFYRAVMLP